MKIELIYFDGCPNVSETRVTLLKALAQLKLPVKWIEWNQKDKNCPKEFSHYGSPTVLINGIDILSTKLEQQGNCCRIYSDEQGKPRGSPSFKVIIAAMSTSSIKDKEDVKNSDTSKWVAFLAAIPSVFIALLPKLTCPMCWPAYTALLASIGVNFANYTPYLPIIIVSLLMISLVSIGYKAKSRHGYSPLWLGAAASLGIISGQLIWNSQIVFFSGSTLLIIAAIWNAWPNKKACCQTKVKSCCSVN